MQSEYDSSAHLAIIYGLRRIDVAHLFANIVRQLGSIAYSITSRIDLKMFIYGYLRIIRIK